MSKPEDYIDVVREVDGRFIAEIRELPGVMAYGSTKEEALSAVMALAISVLADRARQIREQEAYPVDRGEVYAAIDGEREYQETRWNCSTTESCGRHSVAEFLAFIRDYTEEALHHLARNGEPEASQFALNSVRKLAGLTVACMEQHGAPRRKP